MAGLVAKAVQGARQCVGDGHAGGDRPDHLDTTQLVAPLRHEARLVEAGDAQEALKLCAVEPSGGVLESRFLLDRRGDQGVRRLHPQAARRLVQQGIVDQRVHRLIQQSQAQRQLQVQAWAEHPLQAAEFGLEGRIQLLHGDALIADGRHRGPHAAAGEDIGDAEAGEADGEQDEEDLDDPGTDLAADKLKHELAFASAPAAV